MRSLSFFTVILLFITGCSETSKQPVLTVLNPELQGYLANVTAEFDQIDPARKDQLEKIAEYVRARTTAGDSARLTFICTHNSRRSHMSQLWARVAAVSYGFDQVVTFSGGTEATAFNPRAVRAMTEAGFTVTAGDSTANPVYQVGYGNNYAPMQAFSKKFEDKPNPAANFAAVMTCSKADKECPYVPGCDVRIAIPYEDPKIADGTPEEEARYRERSRQICREMFYLFSKV